MQKTFLQKLFSIKTFGNSMFPLLHNGDIVFFKKVKTKDVHINDIIVIRKKNKLITHRVIHRQKNTFITKGDNNLLSDIPTKIASILGKVTKIKRENEEFSPEQLYLLQSTLYFREMTKVNTLFKKNDINFLFLKGLPLHLILEKTYPKRFYGDCDLLVDKKDFQKSLHLLEKIGYTTEQKPPLSVIHRFLNDAQSEISLVKNIDGLKVNFDMHQEINFLMPKIGKLSTLYSQKKMDSFSQLLLHSKKLYAINHDAFPLVAPPYLLFVYLTLHLAHHNFRGYNRYHLIDMLLKKQNIDFQKTIALIKEYQLENFCYPVFILLKKHYNTHIPAKVIEAIKPSSNQEAFIKASILPLNIFEDEFRMSEGVRRFKTLFTLSPHTYRRYLTFFYPHVIISVLSVMLKRRKLNLSSR